MAETQPLAPTDAEIVALADATRTAEGGANGYILPISFARAVLAKWGAQPVARDPLTDEQVEALIATKHFREGYELKASDRTCLAWYRLGLRDGERAHGIKGGQHGAE